MIFKFRNRKNKNIKKIEYSKIKDLLKYDDRVKALRDIFIVTN